MKFQLKQMLSLLMTVSLLNCNTAEIKELLNPVEENTSIKKENTQTKATPIPPINAPNATQNTSIVDIKINPLPLNLPLHKSPLTLGAKITLSRGKELMAKDHNEKLEWKTSDDSIARVENNQLILLKEGKITLTATAINNTEINEEIVLNISNQEIAPPVAISTPTPIPIQTSYPEESYSKWLSGQERDAELARRIRAGFFPIVTEGRFKNGSNQYRSVYVPSYGCSYTWRGFTKDDFTKIQNKLTELGYQQIFQQSFIGKNNIERFQGVWSNPQSSRPCPGFSLEDLLKKQSEGQGQGLEEDT